jgi:multicomponent Na+:H+ antiporter subunit D
MPFTAAAMALAGASLVGIPGTVGFISKWLLLQAAFEQGAFGIMSAVVVVASSLAAVYYVWRIVEAMYFGTPTSGETATTDSAVAEAPWPLLAGLWVVALANIYFGLVPLLPITLAETAASALLGTMP